MRNRVFVSECLDLESCDYCRRVKKQGKCYKYMKHCYETCSGCKGTVWCKLLIGLHSCYKLNKRAEKTSINRSLSIRVSHTILNAISFTIQKLRSWYSLVSVEPNDSGYYSITAAKLGLLSVFLHLLRQRQILIHRNWPIHIFCHLSFSSGITGPVKVDKLPVEKCLAARKKGFCKYYPQVKFFKCLKTCSSCSGNNNQRRNWSSSFLILLRK